MSPRFSKTVLLAIEKLAAAPALAPEFRKGPLLDPRAYDGRYGNVPPEAFSFLDSGCDGCHYALWLDDPAAQDHEPPVVAVSPMDGTPETVMLAAPNAAEFLVLIGRSGPWRTEDNAARAEAEQRAIAARREFITYETADTLGVFCAPGAPGLALATARDRIAEGNADPEALAELYRDLGREELALVALASYR